MGTCISAKHLTPAPAPAALLSRHVFYAPHPNAHLISTECASQQRDPDEEAADTPGQRVAYLMARHKYFEAIMALCHPDARLHVNDDYFYYLDVRMSLFERAMSLLNPKGRDKPYVEREQFLTALLDVPGFDPLAGGRPSPLAFFLSLDCETAAKEACCPYLRPDPFGDTFLPALQRCPALIETINAPTRLIHECRILDDETRLLHAAVCLRNGKAVAMLLRLGADPTAHDAIGDPPFFTALKVWATTPSTAPCHANAAEAACVARLLFYATPRETVVAADGTAGWRQPRQPHLQPGAARVATELAGVRRWGFTGSGLTAAEETRLAAGLTLSVDDAVPKLFNLSTDRRFDEWGWRWAWTLATRAVASGAAEAHPCLHERKVGPHTIKLGAIHTWLGMLLQDGRVSMVDTSPPVALQGTTASVAPSVYATCSEYAFMVGLFL